MWIDLRRRGDRPFANSPAADTVYKAHPHIPRSLRDTIGAFEQASNTLLTIHS